MRSLEGGEGDQVLWCREMQHKEAAEDKVDAAVEPEGVERPRHEYVGHIEGGSRRPCLEGKCGRGSGHCPATHVEALGERVER